MLKKMAMLLFMLANVALIIATQINVVGEVFTEAW